jgi:nitroreductase
MTVLDLLNKRHAVKSFNGEKIPEEDIEKMKESIRLAPSSFNWQPWKIKIVSDKETLEKLQGAAFNQPQVGSASHLFVFCAVKDLDKNNEKLLNNLKGFMPEEKFENFSSYLNGAIASMTPESKERMAERELFTAVENLLLSATELGYGSCPMGGFNHEEFRKILNIPEELSIVVIAPVGFANDEVRPKYRFSKEEIFF